MPRAQSTTILPGPYGQEDPRNFHQVLSFADGQVIPRTLRIALRLRKEGTEEEQAASAQGLMSGIWWGQPWLVSMQATMRLSVGSREGIKRSIFADVRDGDFNLPPCDQVDIHLAYWRPKEDGHDYPLDISAEIADGGSLESTPLTFTAAKLTTAITSYCVTPPGACALDAQAGEDGIMVTASSDVWSPSGLCLIHVPSSGVRFPPLMPLLLGPHRVLRVSSPDVPGGQMWCPQLTFFVR